MDFRSQPSKSRELNRVLLFIGTGLTEQKPSCKKTLGITSTKETLVSCLIFWSATSESNTICADFNFSGFLSLDQLLEGNLLKACEAG